MLTTTSRETLHALINKFSGRAPRHEGEELWKHIGLGGDDAHEFMEEFSKTFGVDLSNGSGFAFDRYFPYEGEAIGEGLLMALGFKAQWAPLTVRHLLDVIEAGTWIDP